MFFLKKKKVFHGDPCDRYRAIKFPDLGLDAHLCQVSPDLFVSDHLDGPEGLVHVAHRQVETGNYSKTTNIRFLPNDVFRLILPEADHGLLGGRVAGLQAFKVLYEDGADGGAGRRRRPGVFLLREKTICVLVCFINLVVFHENLRFVAPPLPVLLRRS